MSEHEAIELLIPWYANGTLDPAGRDRVDGHLRTCSGCAELLEQAEDQRRLLRSASADGCLDEVHPRLLAGYAEAPHRLDPETRDWVERCLGRSPLSQDALELLEASMQAEQAGQVEPAGGSPARSWLDWAWVFLRPVPAMAYLLLLVVLVPTLWTLRDRGGVIDSAVAPAVTTVRGESVSRSDRPTRQPPLELSGSGMVILELETELSISDLQTLGARFAFEVRRGDLTLITQDLPMERFRARDTGTVVSVMLALGRFRTGEAHELSLRARKPGDPIDGQALFRRGVIILE